MEVIKHIYNLRRNFVIIGLTGRTGSGCSMLSEWMSYDRDKYRHELLDLMPQIKEPYNNNHRKIQVVTKFIREKWTPFTLIKASDVIVYFALLKKYADFQTVVTRDNSIKMLASSDESKLVEQLSSLQSKFNELHEEAIIVENVLEETEKPTAEQLMQCMDFLQKRIPPFRMELQKELGNKYISIFQQFGNNIRQYNSIMMGTESEHAPSCLARKIKQFIKAQHRINKENGEPTYIVIDALRNPYEILYFRERYASFYVMSMNTTDEVRCRNLQSKKYTNEQIETIDNQEKGKKNINDCFLMQDIDKCIELSDIHLAWENSFEEEKMGQELPFEENKKSLTEGQIELLKQLSTYIALIMHPGLVPPTPHERVMQVAYTAKLNSGCLSRQVGAVVTNTDFSVKSIGWNTVPQGQTPCSLRCLLDLCGNNDSIAYSEYERKEPFLSTTKKLLDSYQKQNAEIQLDGLRIPYCFKDIHTSSEEEQSHNQVHTRSLHAEENAFLQLAKYGTIGIRDGYLFTTASCCELCAKKAYQLGIKKIFYIDAYPGITKDHILASGDSNHQPEMILFRGAVGRAYISLFNPYVPLKDEIKVRTGVDVKIKVKPEKSDKK